MEPEGRGALLIFDGDCGFCTSAVTWVSRHWRPGADAVPWQRLSEAKLASIGLSVADAGAAAWWVDPDLRLQRGHLAIAKALEQGRGWRRVAGGLVMRPPLRWLAAAVYPLVVRWRHRLPGGTPACRMPTSDRAE
ncbi:MAG TPA: DCC1-like thiol-disulfide oxidoreductase family protein [Acidimicrobiales bacterium]|nr:DCC1-like thiol-disulfide oxidoreductase family protein [Acidimicrobiales bacterium]